MNTPSQQIPATDVAERLYELLQAESDPVRRQVLEAARKQLLCMQEVHRELDATEYDSETAQTIANLLTEVGFEIRDIGEIEQD